MDLDKRQELINLFSVDPDIASIDQFMSRSTVGGLIVDALIRHKTTLGAVEGLNPKKLAEVIRASNSRLKTSENGAAKYAAEAGLVFHKAEGGRKSTGYLCPKKTRTQNAKARLLELIQNRPQSEDKTDLFLILFPGGTDENRRAFNDALTLLVEEHEGQKGRLPNRIRQLYKKLIRL